MWCRVRAAAPFWVKEPQNLLYSPGETVRLDCQAEGIPTPLLTWSLNGEPLTGTLAPSSRRPQAVLTPSSRRPSQWTLLDVAVIFSRILLCLFTYFHARSKCLSVVLNSVLTVYLYDQHFLE